MNGTNSLSVQDDSIIFPNSQGKTVVFLGKEALLARLTSLRSTGHENIVDRFFHLSRDRAYYYTNVYVLAEMFTSARYRTSAQTAVTLRTDLLASDIEILHGGEPWDIKAQTTTPKEVFLAAIQLFENRTKIDCNFQEATLVLEAAGSEADFVFTYDGIVATLARSFGLDVLPYDDSIRSQPNS